MGQLFGPCYSDLNLLILIICCWCADHIAFLSKGINSHSKHEHILQPCFAEYQLLKKVSFKSEPSLNKIFLAIPTTGWTATKLIRFILRR